MGGQVEDDLLVAYLGRHLGELANGDVGMGGGDVVGFAIGPAEEDMEQGAGAIDDIAPGAVLLSGALQHDVLAPLDVSDELRINAVVGLGEEGSKGVAGTGDDHVCPIFGGIGHAKGFGGSLGRRVARPGTERVDIAAVVFVEDTAVSLAIYLACRHIEESLHVVV